MKRTRRRRQWIGGFVALGLIASGLSAAPASAAGGPNLSLGRSASASATNGGFPAAHVTDGNANSYWESPNNAFPQWVQVDLGTATAVDQVVLKLPPATAWATRTQTLSVQGSTNGSS